MTTDDFTGMRVLVTGGASGIGQAIATAVLARGGTVAVLDLDPSTAPVGAVAFTADVSDDASIATAVAAAVVASSVSTVNTDLICSRACAESTGRPCNAVFCNSPSRFSSASLIFF